MSAIPSPPQQPVIVRQRERCDPHTTVANTCSGRKGRVGFERKGNTVRVPLEVNVTLSLPRDELTVPVVRHLCNSAMQELGVAPGCKSDILLALTEACTNVIDHSDDAHQYEVHLMLNEQRCRIQVKDEGAGFDHAGRDDSRTVDLSAEEGRGIDLMHALVDRVSFVSEPQEGTIVSLYKELEFVDGHPVRERLLNGK